MERQAMTSVRTIAHTAADIRPLTVRKIGVADLREALSQGVEDFLAIPSQLLLLGVIYPVVGVIAARAASGADLLPLVYPLVAGLALMGPVTAVGIYELSRRREKGLPVSWRNAFDVLRSPAIGSILLLGLMLVAILVAWLASAQAIYDWAMGGVAAASPAELIARLQTPAGLKLFLVGNAVGLVFALVTFALTVVSFPLLLDRDVGPIAALRTSLAAVAANPGVMALWAATIAVTLVIGALPLFAGLAVVMPVLGHASWRLYRKVVAT
jgi:uncharacterized membrane protein